MTVFRAGSPEQVIDDVKTSVLELPEHVQKDAGVLLDNQKELEAKIARLNDQITAKRQAIVDQCLLSIGCLAPDMQMDVLYDWTGLDAKAFPLSAAFGEMFEQKS